MTEQDDLAELRTQLEYERRVSARLRRQTKQYHGLARRAVQAKADEAQQGRDLGQVLEEMRQRLEQEKTNSAAVADTAQKVVEARDGQLARIADQCRLWKRGELDTMTTIAGICGEVEGHPLPEPGIWERLRAVRHVETLSQHRELTDTVAEIERILKGAGVGRVSTVVQQVLDMVLLYEAAADQIDEWKGLEARARGAAIQLLDHFGQGGGSISAHLQAGRYDEVLGFLRAEGSGGQ